MTLNNFQILSDHVCVNFLRHYCSINTVPRSQRQEVTAIERPGFLIFGPALMRSIRAIGSLRRTIYISARSSRGGDNRSAVRGLDRKFREEAALIDAQLKDLKNQQTELRRKIREDKDRSLQQQLAERENANIDGEASPEEISALEDKLSLKSENHDFDSTILASSRQEAFPQVPLSIRKLLPSSPSSSTIQLFPKKEKHNWVQIFAELPVLPENVPVHDVEKLVCSIPLKQRSQIVRRIEMCIPEPLQTQFVKDNIMAGYAEIGGLDDVRRVFDSCQAPTVFSFGHLAKATFKTGASPEDIFSLIKGLKDTNIEPSLPIMSTAIQSLIQHGRHKEAESLFDNLKYWSVGTQPDLKLYNSMILSAAKQHNVNRCLDLLAEMKDRRPFPLQPNAETFNYAIAACAREPETQLKAWDLFLEARSLGFAPDQQSFKALLYLCGSSGEVSLARALIRNLSETSLRHVDSFALNCLFLAYKNWQPGPSKILSSPSGRSIRENLIMNSNFDNGLQSQVPHLPLLPVAQLNEPLILAESHALMEYFADFHPQTLAAANPATRATSPIVHNYLDIAVVFCDNIEEFRSRYSRYTRSAGDKEARLLAPEPTDDALAKDLESQFVKIRPHTNFTIERGQYLYQLAMRAAIKFKSLDFGREVWTERGKWRRLTVFRNLPQDERNAADFRFARYVVDLLAVCGQVEEALMLVKSTKNLKKWKYPHLKPLIEACEAIEDAASVSAIKAFLKSQNSN